LTGGLLVGGDWIGVDLPGDVLTLTIDGGGERWTVDRKPLHGGDGVELLSEGERQWCPRCNGEGWRAGDAGRVRCPGESGRLVLNVLASVAQWEREAIADRTATALEHKRDNGEYTGGGVPFGLALVDGGKVEPKQEEQTIIHRARAIRAASPALSLRAIGDRLHQEGLRPRNGGPWAAQQVKRLLSV